MPQIGAVSQTNSITLEHKCDRLCGIVRNTKREDITCADTKDLSG